MEDFNGEAVVPHELPAASPRPTGSSETPGPQRDDGLEFDGKKPIEYLNSFDIGIKDDPSLAGK